MKRQLYDTPEDCRWLEDTHLRQYNGSVLGFASFILEGNEDCPEGIELFVSEEPRVTDGFVRLDYNSETDTYERR